MMGREEEAIKVLKDVARINAAGTASGVSAVPDSFRLQMPKEEGEGGNFCDLFSPQLWVTTSLLWVIWCTNVLTYYGIVLVIPMYFKDDATKPYTSSGAPAPATIVCGDDSEFTSAFINTCAELPACFLACFIIDRIGRKKTMLSFFILAGVCTLLMVWRSLPKGILMLFAMGARMGYSGAFLATFVYTPEVYPTSVRCVGLGAASAMGRIAGMVTDHVAVLGHENLATPCLIYGVCSLIAAVAVFMLPIETGGAALSDGTEEVEMLALEQSDRGHNAGEAMVEDAMATSKMRGDDEFSRLSEDAALDEEEPHHDEEARGEESSKA